MKVSAIQGYKAPYYKKNSDNLNKENKSNNYSMELQSFGDKTGFYNINFTGADSNSYMKKFDIMRRNFSPQAESLYKAARAYAARLGSKEVESWHLYAVSLMSLNKFLHELDEGKRQYGDGSVGLVPNNVESTLEPKTKPFSKPEKRQKFERIIDEYIAELPEKFVVPDGKFYKHSFDIIKPSKNLVNDMDYSQMVIMSTNQMNDYTFFDSYFFVNGVLSRNSELSKKAQDFLFDMRSALMIDDSDKKQKNHLSIYDDKADTVWKNINMGKDSICIYDADNEKSAEHFVSSFVNLVNKPGKKYKNIDPKNTNIVVMNNIATFDFLHKYISNLKSDPNAKGKQTVIVADLYSLIASLKGQVNSDDMKLLSGEYKKGLNDRKINIVFTVNDKTYYANAEKDAPLSSVLNKYSAQTIPSLTAGDTVKYLTDDSGIRYIEDRTKRKMEPEVIRRAVELTVQDDGNYPDKAVQLLSDVSEYFSDEDKITKEHIEHYVEQNRAINNSSNTEKELDIIFDTGKTLEDIVGTPMTKAYAESVVKEIKNGIGVKGYTIYNANGTAYGGGRKHVAEAIAGEAKIPMIKINAKDFALKDIDAVSQNSNFLESKMKKIVATAKAQAEANPNKTAMIFIENFDNFGSNPLYGISSIYEQKAFTQLLNEMDNARNNEDINLVVMGSTNMPYYLDENIMKPDKFLNEIIVYNPNDLKERAKLIQYYVDKKKVNIEGNKKEQQEIIDYAAKTTRGTSVVGIMHLIDRAKLVASERGHEKVSREDLTEAFLQNAVGLANMAFLPNEYKKVVTSHEAGHALNMVIMDEIARKSGNKRHIPNQFNFITLDPRGTYGGATFHTRSEENLEFNFETGMADIILSYGGNSAEDIIYDQNGSWGITADMDSAEETANLMICEMGMGPRTGVRRVPRKLDGSYNVTDKKFENIEDDKDSFLNAGKLISDMIVEAYKGFLIEFTERYADRVGTGDCIVPSEDFIKELNEWREKQSDKKKEDLDGVNDQIVNILNKVKYGEDFRKN